MILLSDDKSFPPVSENSFTGLSSIGQPDSSASPSSAVQPPPSYFRGSEYQDIDPSEKTPAFPIHDSAHAPGPQSPSLSTGSSSKTYYAPVDPSASYANADSDMPSSFSRVAPADLPYPTFPPMFLVAKSKSLSKGFPLAPPPSTIQPHPFMSHDITEADWLSFLHEVRAAATLTEKEIRWSYLPIMPKIPIVSGVLALVIQKYMKAQKREGVIKVIDTWNHHFFELRKLRVVLMRDQTKLSGLAHVPGDVPPSPANMSLSGSPGTQSNDDQYRLFVVSI
ncbi:hypothetical protein BDZ97DRAFT_1759372 [Flammula alnicola]|nr:hypothetical protein BDZ97DRAFT_1759372 [Flammula alnicola]